MTALNGSLAAWHSVIITVLVHATFSGESGLSVYKLQLYRELSVIV